MSDADAPKQVGFASEEDHARLKAALKMVLEATGVKAALVVLVNKDGHTVCGARVDSAADNAALLLSILVNAGPKHVASWAEQAAAALMGPAPKASA